MTWHEAYLELQRMADMGYGFYERSALLRTLIQIRDQPER
jgi:hypothetical protein